jgi:hypothetical protein
VFDPYYVTESEPEAVNARATGRDRRLVTGDRIKDHEFTRAS